MAPKKLHFQKNFEFFIFSEALNNSSKEKISQKRKINRLEKCQKKDFSKMFSNTKLFWTDFWGF
jgi:hypothetical protein